MKPKLTVQPTNMLKFLKILDHNLKKTFHFGGQISVCMWEKKANENCYSSILKKWKYNSYLLFHWLHKRNCQKWMIIQFCINYWFILLVNWFANFYCWLFLYNLLLFIHQNHLSHHIILFLISSFSGILFLIIHKNVKNFSATIYFS